MGSIANLAIRGLFRVRKWFSNSAKPHNYQKLRRYNFNEADVKKKYADEIGIEKIHDHAVYTFQPELKRAVIWLHGGGYVRGPIRLHFERWLDVCKETQTAGYLLDYPKSPEYCHHDTRSFLFEFYDQKIKKENHTEFYLIGDSAGGALAVSLVFELQRKGLPLPAAIFLFSPALDYSFSQPDIEEYAHMDPLLDLQSLKQHARHYSRGDDLKNEWISPLFSTAEKLPCPLHIYATQDELCFPSIRDFKNKYPEAKLHLYQNLLHDWPLLPIKEGELVVKEVIQMIKDRDFA